MQETTASLVRQLGPRDHLRFPELKAISACLDVIDVEAPPTLAQLLDALGEQANHVTLAVHNVNGGYDYIHFGKTLAADAGFDMTDRSTREFDAKTRLHIETSYRQVLDAGTTLCTIMPSAPGSPVHSWQRVVFPVTLDTGLCLMTMVKPLHKALDAIHARRDDLAVCVLPLKLCPDDECFKLATSDPLLRYLGDVDPAPVEDFVGQIGPIESALPVGTLVSTGTMELTLSDGKVCPIILDVVHGFTTPFLVVVDATGSCATNDALRSATHMLKATAELGRMGAWMARERSTDRIYVSPELSELVGIYPDDDGTTPLESFRARYSDELLEAVQNAVAECWEHGTSYVVEGSLIHRDNQYMDVRISGSPMRDQSGKIISLIGTVQDVSEQQAAKRSLEESEERFRDFAGSAGDWCWETDENHRFIDFTEGFEKAGLYEQNQFVGKTRRELPLIPEDRAIIEEHFEDLEAHAEINDLIYRLYDPNGEGIMSYKINGRPRFDNRGKFLGYRGTGSNITEKVAADRLHQENQLALHTAQQIAGLGHWTTDLKSGFTQWSDNIMHILGLLDDGEDHDHLTGKKALPTMRFLLSRTHRKDRRKIINAVHEVSRSGVTPPVDIRYYRDRDAKPKHLRIMLRREPATLTSAAKLIGVAQDTSDLKRIQSELEKRTAMLNEAQAMGGIGDWQYDSATNTLVWSSQLCALLGFDPNSFQPDAQSIYHIYPPDDGETIACEHRKVLEQGVESRLDVQARRGDGTFGYYSMVTKPQFNSKGDVVGMFGTVQDITERKHAEKQLRTLAFFDPLTGLANRALFTRELQDVLYSVRVKGGSAALLLLDLDHFKEVNDTLGHAAGDELLASVAATLKAHVKSKGFVARLGGDEFAIIVRDYSSVEDLDRFADSVVEALTGVLKLERGEVQTGTSLGISLIPQDGGNAEEALRNADLALYMAKGDGRGKALFFQPDMSRSVQARLNLARDLRRAVEEGKLETRYQGQVCLETGKVSGFETLVRWKHPVRGYISPAEFVPVAESSSLICDIGLWVLRDACKTGRAWLDAGEPERMISVNVSAAQIWQTDFEDDVMAIIEETGYPPHLLCLELTESVFADHGEGRVRMALARFKEVGIHLALDDFGTGYSSLGYLNELPFDELKIDRCFVFGAHKADDKARLLQGIIALGKGLGMRVVGEGAEDQGEIDLLRACNCDLVQGFAYMRPEVAEEALRCAEQIEFRLAENNQTHLADFGDALKKAG